METTQTPTRFVSLTYKERAFTIEAAFDGESNGWSESVRETMPDGTVTHWPQTNGMAETPADCISNALNGIITTIDDDESSATSFI